ncbi:MAG: NAD(P)-dependent oxidoreductase [Desulfamplus sp.]|nr:NAD(P)-dependent oxidoreductase [Desulfamplus sp.]
MRVLVTGASGYLGGRISQYLSFNGYEVIALVRDSSRLDTWNHQRIEVIEGDIQDEELKNNLASKNIDSVVYTISLNHKQCEENIEKTIGVNVTPMWELLKILSQAGLKRFIYFSTQHIYGRLPLQRIDENFTPKPLNNYGLTHLMCEHVCQLLNSRTDTKCINLRLSNGYGAPQFNSCDCWSLVINDFCKTAFEEREIRLQSDGTPQRDFIHISDICNALNLLLQTDSNSLEHTNYHLGSGQTYTMLELAHIVANVYQKKYHQPIPVVFSDGRVSKNAQLHSSIEKFQYDIQRISSLGYEIHVNLETGISEVFDFLNTFSS